MTDVLYGDWNPSGRLPYTIAKRIEDYSAQVITGNGIQTILSIPYTEGLQIDYRHFDAVSLKLSPVMLHILIVIPHSEKHRASLRIRLWFELHEV